MHMKSYLVLLALLLTGCALPPVPSVQAEQTRETFTAFTAGTDLIIHNDRPYLCAMMTVVRGEESILNAFSCYESMNAPEQAFNMIAKDIPFTMSFNSVYSCTLDEVKAVPDKPGNFAYKFSCN